MTDNQDKTFDERQFEQEVAEDTFQKEVDEAIKSFDLNNFLKTNNIELLDLDKKVLEYEIESQGVKYKHKVKVPLDEDEARKEAMSVVIRKEAGKIAGDNVIETNRDNAKAMLRYYNGLATEVFGYPIEETDNPEEWRKLDIVVFEASGDVAPQTLLDFIPESDKLKVAEMILSGRCFVINEKERIKSVKTTREYIVKQLFGVERDEEGYLSKPKNILAYHFSEAKGTAIGKFEQEAIQVRTRLSDPPEERRVINIYVCKELFAKHITRIQGAILSGEELGQVNAETAKRIPAAFQRDALFIYMNFLKS